MKVGCNDMPKSVLQYIAIWKTHIAIYIAIHLVSVFLSIIVAVGLSISSIFRKRFNFRSVSQKIMDVFCKF